MLLSHLGEGLCQPFGVHKRNHSSHLNSIIEFIKPLHIYYTFDPQQPGESGLICAIILFYSSGEVKWLVQTVALLGVSTSNNILATQHSASPTGVWERWYQFEQKSLRSLCRGKIVDIRNGHTTGFPRHQKNAPGGKHRTKGSYNPVLKQPSCVSPQDTCKMRNCVAFSF